MKGCIFPYFSSGQALGLQRFTPEFFAVMLSKISFQPSEGAGQITFPPVDLYLISEKSIWKNQVQQTGFLVYFELDFH